REANYRVCAGRTQLVAERCDRGAEARRDRGPRALLLPRTAAARGIDRKDAGGSGDPAGWRGRASREGRKTVRDARGEAAGDRGEPWRGIWFGETVVAGALRRIGGAGGGGDWGVRGSVRVGCGEDDMRGRGARR